MRAGWMQKTRRTGLRCSFLTHPCTWDDLLKFNDIGYKCTPNEMHEIEVIYVQFQEL